MITGSIRSQIDAIWDAFWSGGISNPLEVIEQITYLLFLKRLDENQLLEERRATELGQPMRRSYFPEGNDESGQPYSDMRWSHFKNFAPQRMFDVVDNRIFHFCGQWVVTTHRFLSTWKMHAIHDTNPQSSASCCGHA